MVELIEPSKKPKTQAQQQQTPPPQTQQPPAFYALKGTTEEERRKEFKGLDDDLKIQVMYKEASSVKDPVNVYTTYLNYLGIIDRKKMRAKLIGVLLQTENADNIRDAKELARQSGITELVVAANNTADVNNTALVAACDHYTQKTIDGWRFGDLQVFFVGDGARAAKGTSFEGMIKYDTMHTIGEQPLAALNLASGNQKELMDIEKNWRRQKRVLSTINLWKDRRKR